MYNMDLDVHYETDTAVVYSSPSVAVVVNNSVTDTQTVAQQGQIETA